jgi:thiol-disulfide isomerase/thioredoxin
MSIRLKIIISCLFISFAIKAQSVAHVYKINDLVKRVDTSQTTLIVNFWATWCKPCVQELPAFDSLNTESKNYKVILVSLDFKEDIKSKVNPFLKKNHIKSECVLLDEVNGNDFIDKISKEWSGAIPATLFKNTNKKIFIEKKMRLEELNTQLSNLKN